MKKESIQRYIDSNILVSIVKNIQIDEIVNGLITKKERFSKKLEDETLSGSIYNVRYNYMSMHNSSIDKRIKDLKFIKKISKIFSNRKKPNTPVFWTDRKLFKLIQWKDKMTEDPKDKE
jgi:hypothetical protein